MAIGSWLFGVVLFAGACVPRSQTRLIEIEAPPGEMYDCVIYELARRGFTIVDADRASHFIQAQRVDRDWMGENHTLEIYATVIPHAEDAGRYLQLASNGRANDEATGIAAECTAAAPQPGSR
jgi:hypothetical protein